MFVKLSQSKQFWHYHTSDLTDLTLTIYDDEGTLVTSLATTAMTTAPIDFMRITAAYTFSTAGAYRIKWAATGYTDWEECLVETEPPNDEYPNNLRKYLVEGTGWGTPQLYILDNTLTAVTSCALTQLAASVTSTKVVASYTIPASSDIELTFDATSPTYSITLTTGVRTLLEVLDEINSQIRFGRALTSAGKLRIESDSLTEDTQVVLDGDAAVLTELGLTAGTYTASYTSPPISLTAVDSSLAYETDEYIKLPEGNYVFIWCDDTTVQATEDVFIYSDNTYADTTFEIVESTTSQALAGVEVALLNSDGVTVRRGYSMPDGRFYTSLPPGAYYAVLRRDKHIFGINNFTVNVVDRHSTTATNDFVLSTNFLTPRYTDAPLVGQDYFSTMKAQFVDLQGNPIAGLKILISHNYVPFQTTSVAGTAVAVTGHPLIVQTDGMGMATTQLVRGLTVEVAIEGTSIRRNLLVPSQTEFNLLDHFTQDDLFDIVRLQVPAAVQADI